MTGVGTPALAIAEQNSSKLMLVQIKDGDLYEGDVFTKLEFQEEQYPGLLKSFWSGDTWTIASENVVFAHPQMISEKADAYTDLMGTIPGIVQAQFTDKEKVMK